MVHSSASVWRVDIGRDWSQLGVVKRSQPPGCGQENMEESGECLFGQIPIEIVRSPGIPEGRFHYSVGAKNKFGVES